MNNVFNFKRFAKYYSYDLNNAIGSYGLSAIVTGMLPLILLFFSVLFSLIFTGEVATIPPQVKIFLFGIAVLVVILSAPAKLYGRLTERKAGTDWLMIPASPFEKFLSMALMLCVLLPLVVFGLFAACDLLLGWIVPAYGGSILATIKQTPDIGDLTEMMTDMPVIRTTAGGTVASIWAGWCASVLPFGLGAICFKKGKAAKTILCIFALEIVLSMFFVLVLKGVTGSFDGELFVKSLFDGMSAEKVQFWTNFLINALYFVIIGGLLAAIYFRVKTIKH